MQSIIFRRLIPGRFRALSWPSSFEMLPTGIWIPSSLVLWWHFKKSCNSLALSATSVVTLALSFHGSL